MQWRPRQHNTAPSRLRKRDVPTAWDIFALEERASAASIDEDDSSQASVPSLNSIDQSSDFDSFDRNGYGGSWPRYRKQRTSTKGSMSAFEAADALGSHNGCRDVFSQLATLVAAEEQELSTSASTDAMSNVSIETFVDAVFDGIAPALPHMDSVMTASAAANGVSDVAVQSSSSAPAWSAECVQATVMTPYNTSAGTGKCWSANDLLLLDAIHADEAAARADQRRAMQASPTFAACMGNLDEACMPADDKEDMVHLPLHILATHTLSSRCVLLDFP
jgi:hypothetical protein